MTDLYRLSRAAKELLEDSEGPLRVSFAEAGDQIVEAWKKTGPKDFEAREALFAEFLALRRVLSRLTALSDHAKVQQAEQQQGSRAGP